MKKMLFVFMLQSLLVVASDQSRRVHISNSDHTITIEGVLDTLFEVPPNLRDTMTITVEAADPLNDSVIEIPSGLSQGVKILVQNNLEPNNFVQNNCAVIGELLEQKNVNNTVGCSCVIQ